MFPSQSAIAVSMLARSPGLRSVRISEGGESALAIEGEPCPDCRPRETTERVFAALDFELGLAVTRKGHPALVALAERNAALRVA